MKDMIQTASKTKKEPEKTTKLPAGIRLVLNLTKSYFAKNSLLC